MAAIRKLELADEQVVESLLGKVFAGTNAGGIVERELALGFETCWVAVENGEVIGLACAVQHDSLAYIGPMAVATEYQGRGIGTALFERLLESLESRNCSTMMLDATDLGEPLYRKFGFVESAITLDMGRDGGPGIAKVSSVGNLDQVLLLDRRVFGADRAPIFRRFLDYEGASLYSDASGYLVAQSKLLGPFAALDVDAAERVLDQAISDGAVASRVLAPAENRAAAGLLQSRGFHVQREVKHMRRGRPSAMRRDLMYGLASFALG